MITSTAFGCASPERTPAWFEGSWKSDAGSPTRFRVEVSPSGGSYEGENCQGALTPLDHSDMQAAFGYLGAANAECPELGTIILSRIDAAKSEYRWFDAEGAIRLHTTIERSPKVAAHAERAGSTAR